MEPITALLALLTVLFVAAFIAQPLVSGGRGEASARSGRGAASVLRRRAELLAERNRLYAAIRDLDFDYKTNKVSDEDYAAQRYKLVADAVETLQLLDALPDVGEEAPAADPVEALIAARRAGQSPVAVGAGAPRAAAYCPHCGAPAQPGDRFCGSCGARL